MATLPLQMSSDGTQEPSAPTQVAKDQGEKQQGDFGPNNEQLEKLKPELVSALRQLVLAYRQEGIYGRRLEIRRIRQARLFWQELQYGWFDPFSMNWRLPFGTSGMQSQTDSNAQDYGRFQFVTNFYQAFGLSFISIMSQDTPSVNFYPQSVDDDQDISAAKAATDATELIELNNHVSELLTKIGYLLWTDGKIGSYTRYVADGERFGFQEMPNLEAGAAPIGQDVYQCPGCGQEVPASGMPLGGMCPSCGAPLGDENLNPSPLVAVPEQTGSEKLPNGQEVITIVGGLELNTPINVDEIWEMPWLQWQQEVHQAKLKAAYPHVRNQIGAASLGVEGPDDTYARVTRLAVAQSLPTLHPGDSLNKYATFTRTWLRPWAFEDLENTDTREQLKKLFPDGCYCAFVGQAYCESRNENMLDYWRVMHAYPGDGQSRPSVGNSLIQVQERINTIENIAMEQFEFGIPPIYADPQVLDFDALTNQTAEPAAHYPARARPGQSLANSFYQPTPPVVGKEMLEHAQELAGPTAQMLTGLFPAVYGGAMDDIKTASAYAQARDQALGRLGLVWRRLKIFYADTMMLAVDCFRKNRPEDAQIPEKAANGEFQAKYIRLMDLKGNIQARAEADETFPRLKSQQKAVVQQLMTIQDPMIGKFFSSPTNMSLLKSLLGLNDFEIPEEDARNEQLREIDELLQGQAVPGPMGEMIPSVPIDPILDVHQAHFETIQHWWASDKGQQARQQNPNGAMNVRAHAMAHFMAMQPPPMPPGEGGAGAPSAGGGEPKGSGPTEDTAPMPEAPEVQA